MLDYVKQTTFAALKEIAVIDATELTRLLRVNTPLLSVDSAEEMPVLAAFRAMKAGTLRCLQGFPELPSTRASH